MNPIDFGGQRSNVKVTIEMYGNKLVNMIENKPLCAFIKLGRLVNHGERMNSIDFGGHRSELKATMGIIYKCGVRGDATLCVVIFTLYSRGSAVYKGKAICLIITKHVYVCIFQNGQLLGYINALSILLKKNLFL